MYAASFRTRCPMRNIEYTSEPMSVTAIKSGARIATKINKAPGVSVPVTIASHSWNWTRISVARKTPVPPHRSPKAIRSLRVDRAPDDREERLLQGHGPDGGGQVFAQRDVHDLVDPRSEEHTSELQSPCNLVCRLLLEKKKNKIVTIGE